MFQSFWALGLGVQWRFLAFQSPRVQQRIKLGFIITLMVLLIGRLVLTWIPFNAVLTGPSTTHRRVNSRLLEWPLLMILSLVILFIYLLPVIMGTRGIWGCHVVPLVGPSDSPCCSWASTPFLPSLIKSQLGDWGQTSSRLNLK